MWIYYLLEKYILITYLFNLLKISIGIPIYRIKKRYINNLINGS